MVDKEHFAVFPAVEGVPWKPATVRVAWQPVHLTSTNYLDLSKYMLNEVITPKGELVEQCIAYAACYLVLPEDVDGWLLIGSDDGYKIWIDGKLFAKKLVYRGAAVDQEKYKLKLGKGKHRVLIKVANDIGGHGIMVRLTDKTGKPLDRATIQLVP